MFFTKMSSLHFKDCLNNVATDKNLKKTNTLHKIFCVFFLIVYFYVFILYGFMDSLSLFFIMLTPENENKYGFTKY